ncbi:hypothetical protein PAXRUDRAFT_9899 [Paxillus rubicundulus Ve08.2h10]|uniref:CMP/dCMP-type deaminase domain-containing protein n=1 Tax=Paxillus rubicundulus Ve08.2h10 TaxID=930991 RepID=A0A0D0E1Z2_9AGAM|nr:hypothetical protein PAXRUDRAFT_9899 [Paxillus rubicundulus Ve08.2h10]
MSDLDKLELTTALAKARESYQKGGVPIGAPLVYHGTSLDTANAVVLCCFHNQRVQKASLTLHAEIATLEDAGQLETDVYRKLTMCTTISPRNTCTGAIYQMLRVVIGENENQIGEELLRQSGVEEN